MLEISLETDLYVPHIHELVYTNSQHDLADGTCDAIRSYAR